MALMLDDTIEIGIPVEADAVGGLQDARVREAVGRIVSRMVQRDRETDPLLAAMYRLAIEPERRGLTQAMLAVELGDDRNESSAAGFRTVTGQDETLRVPLRMI